MATSEYEIDSFSDFGKLPIKNGGSSVSLDELFDEWRIQNPPSEDTLAIQASIRDMQNSETGRPFEEFATEFRKRNNLTRDEGPFA